jgi:hypothetical protein
MHPEADPDAEIRWPQPHESAGQLHRGTMNIR